MTGRHSTDAPVDTHRVRAPWARRQGQHRVWLPLAPENQMRVVRGMLSAMPAPSGMPDTTMPPPVGHPVPAEDRARFLTIGLANANQPGFDEGAGADLIGPAL